MASLKTLLYTGAGEVSVPTLTEFAVANTTESASNGGACCLWTVPSGTRYIKFEMWGGGGGGGGSCCCMQGRPGGSGSYAVKTLSGATQVVPGCQYTICAAGTTGTSPTNAGCTGFTSFVSGFCLGTFCARGGLQGCTLCNNWQGNCQQEQACANVCCSTGGDICIPGISGSARITMYCFNQAQQHAPVAPATVSGPVFGPSGCSNAGVNDSSICKPVFPGGGGFSAQVYGGSCRCGWWGAAGLVLVTYG